MLAYRMTNPVTATECLPRATNANGWGDIAYLAPEVVSSSKHGKPADVYRWVGCRVYGIRACRTYGSRGTENG